MKVKSLIKYSIAIVIIFTFSTLTIIKINNKNINKLNSISPSAGITSTENHQDNDKITSVITPSTNQSGVHQLPPVSDSSVILKPLSPTK